MSNLKNFLISYLSFIFLLSCNSFAKPPTISYLSDSIHNFGVIKQGEKVHHSFYFKNSGDTVLDIEKVKSSCGCTVALPSLTHISPGDSFEIKTTFDSKNFNHFVTKTIFIHSNDPYRPICKIKLEANIIAEISVNPKFIYLDKVKRGKNLKKTITIQNLGKNQLKILSVKTSPHIHIVSPRFSPNTINLKPGNVLKIIISIKTRNISKRINEKLFIKTNNKNMPEFIIKIRGHII